jgi:hypothetical protein
MFDKVSEAAEKLATNVSRRAFLGRLGQGALGLAAVIGGVVALPGRVQAEAQNRWKGCCYYYCVSGPSYKKCVSLSNGCPLPQTGCSLFSSYRVSSCGQC